MKVLVCGSRSWNRHTVIESRMSLLPPGSEIIHGGAEGADLFAGIYARALGLPEHIYAPAYRKTRNEKPAPLERNDFMLELGPDIVLAFWDGQSRGTAYTIREAERRGIPVEVLR